MTTHRLLITAEEAATLLGLARPQLYALARGELIPTVRVGRKVMFSPTALETWVANGGTPLSKGHSALPGVRS